MKILVVNDDGIRAVGIERLAQCAKQFGEVYVVAPVGQCSAMSHRITVSGELMLKKEQFPIEGVEAYSVSGTPADCVKVALEHLLEEKPDFVFSGINNGHNMGYDILYSGTIAAAMEGLINGIPSIAFSCEMNGKCDVRDEDILYVMKELMDRPALADAVWNVNFPSAGEKETSEICWDTLPAPEQVFEGGYEARLQEDGSVALRPSGGPRKECGSAGTDIAAVKSGYISIGKVKNTVLGHHKM